MTRELNPEARQALIETLTHYVIMLTGDDIAPLSFDEKVKARAMIRSAVADNIVTQLGDPAAWNTRAAISKAEGRTP